MVMRLGTESGSRAISVNQDFRTFSTVRRQWAAAALAQREGRTAFRDRQLCGQPHRERIAPLLWLSASAVEHLEVKTRLSSPDGRKPFRRPVKAFYIRGADFEICESQDICVGSSGN